MNNLELYWGPKDGALMDMPVTKDEYGHTRRPSKLSLEGAKYDIFLASDMPDKKPQKGVKYIGVFCGTGE
jgi:hypothetical protein